MKGISILLVFITSHFVYSQESETYQKLKSDFDYQGGYIITSDSVKIKGLIKMKLMSKQYSVVHFVHTDGAKKDYYPSDIKGYGYSYHDFISAEDKFYKVIVTGKKANLYSETLPANTVATGSSTVSFDEKVKFYVKKLGEQKYQRVKKTKFKERFSGYFAECEKLKLKILNGELTHTDIQSIVRQYNYCY